MLITHPNPLLSYEWPGVAGDPGVIHQHIHAPEYFHDLFHHRLGLGVVDTSNFSVLASGAPACLSSSQAPFASSITNDHDMFLLAHAIAIALPFRPPPVTTHLLLIRHKTPDLAN